jgi:meiosis arrest female protein 1
LNPYFKINFNSICELLDPILLVRNLPTDRKRLELKIRLQKLSYNCGGKVFFTSAENSEAIIKFGCVDDAKRAQHRIDSQDVFGKKIVANFVNKESIDNSGQTSSDSDNSNTSDSSTQDQNININMSTVRQRSRANSSQVIEITELMPYCSIHSSPVSENAWTEYLNSSKPLLPMVNISLNLLATRVHHLLDTHCGALPVHSFVDCYVGEFHETFNIRDPPLISLEHLITCVPGVSISISPTNYIKRVTWLQNKDKQFDGSINSEQTTRSSDHLSNKLSHFGKEVRELLKSQTHAIIAFNKFVPAYHTHFVRQLCVSSFGFVKLSELLDEIPHIVQIYGENDGRMITLTHREQTKRFATDLIKVLKAQNGRRIKLSQFPAAYQVVFNKQFDIADYGVCYIDDILKDVWEGTIIIKPFGTNDKWIEIPKRERNSEQIKRTNYFGTEVIRLLSTISNFELTFSKFIPSYHHYYNKQCRVLDYGFTKLIELLEELSPEYIEMEFEEEYGERVIKLNAEKRLKAIAHRFELILKGSEYRSLSITKLCDIYRKKYDSSINYIDYYANDFIDLIDKMPPNRFRITQTKSSVNISLIDKHHLRLCAQRAVRILMEHSNIEMKLCELEDSFYKVYGEKLGSLILSAEFKESLDICMTTKTVKLTPMLLFARDCIQLMQSNSKEKFTLDDLESGLMEKFKRPLPQPYNYKCTSFSELFRKLNDYFSIEKKGKPGKFILLIALSKILKKSPLDIKMKDPPKIQILKRIVKPNCDLLNNGNNNLSVQIMREENDSNNDLLSNGYIPNDIPPPELIPTSNINYDLIRWSPEDSPIPETPDSSDSGRNSPNLMDFIDCCEGNQTGDECSANDLKHVAKSDIGVESLNGNHSFCRKTRIIANFS